MDINRTQILGNLTRSAELKTTPSGQTVANFAVATNHKWKTKEGEDRDTAEFHNCVAWGWLAELVGQLEKGARLMVEGRLQTRSWEKPDGSKAYKTEVVAASILPIKRIELPGRDAAQAEPEAQTEETEAAF